ncbi:hypothetical protein ORD21_18570 [Deinococcus sp. ZS9-10]|uniref:Pilin A4 domain-containing protein n=1 Tax=Deinococcus arenicola TaxID=2994950 RepID=A0ABU4DW04_9DEIO|nr:hypothetical protein [Deinococcus sp. ZS9-10]
MLIPNLLAARTKANESAAQSFVRNTVTAVETNRDSVSGKLTNGGFDATTGAAGAAVTSYPATATVSAQTCTSAQGKAAASLPAGVTSCVIASGTQDNYAVNLVMQNNVIYAYDGQKVAKVNAAVVAP